MGLKYIPDENSPLRPDDDQYAISKTHADKLVQHYIQHSNLPAVIVRPGTMFGPGDLVNFGRMADRLRAGKAAIIGSGANAVPFVYVGNVVHGMLLCAFTEQAQGQIYNLCEDRPLTQEQLWRAIAEDIGVQSPTLHVPYRPLYALAFAAERLAHLRRNGGQPLVTRLGVKMFGAGNRHSIDKARRELGYACPVSVREGVRLTAPWYLGRVQASLAALASPAASVREAV